MAKGILLNRVAIIGGHRISRDANEVRAGAERSVEPTHAWEDSSKRYDLGVYDGSFNVAGHATDDLEWRFLSELASEETPSLPVTIFMKSGNGVPGEVAWNSDGCTYELPTSGEHGKVRGFRLSGKAQSRPAPGPILRSSIGTTGIVAAGDGVAVEVGAVAEGQKLLVFSHVLDYPPVEGTTPTLDHKIQSATDEAFTTPVDRVTLTQFTDAPKGYVHEVAGPVTDTWWRHSVTAVGGTGTPKFWLVVVASIISA